MVSLLSRRINHMINRRYVRTDEGKSFGNGGRSLSSSSLVWLESVNCGVCP